MGLFGQSPNPSIDAVILTRTPSLSASLRSASMACFAIALSLTRPPFPRAPARGLSGVELGHLFRVAARRPSLVDASHSTAPTRRSSDFSDRGTCTTRLRRLISRVGALLQVVGAQALPTAGSQGRPGASGSASSITRARRRGSIPRRASREATWYAARTTAGSSA